MATAPRSSAPGPMRARLWSIRRTVRGFVRDQCPDLAAGLTFFSVLSLFPAAIALVSVLGLFGRAESAVATVLDILRPLVSGQVLSDLEPTIRSLATNRSANWLFALGLLGALWTASAYVAAFGRAMNRIYGVEEGRPLWRLRPAQLLVTILILLLLALSVPLLAVTGPVARSVGRVLEIDQTLVRIWEYAKWPVLALVMAAVIALLYHATPNVRRPRLRLLSVGSLVAICGSVLASAGFSLYLSRFAHYDRTYGSLAGVVVMLLFLWITNLALLFGAELDAELERGRQLRAGIAAEVILELPLRDTRAIERARRRDAREAERGRRIRAAAERPWPPGPTTLETPTLDHEPATKERT